MLYSALRGTGRYMVRVHTAYGLVGCNILSQYSSTLLAISAHTLDYLALETNIIIFYTDCVQWKNTMASDTTAMHMHLRQPHQHE